MDLRKIQQDFVEALENKISLSHLGISEAKIAIYRGSMVGCLTQNLSVTYPVCKRLVGNDFFKQLAKQYIFRLSHPFADMSGYGKHFAAFLNELLTMHGLCYLADVAALEWACHLALNGPAISVLDREALSKIPSEQQGKLRFSLYEGSTLFYSAYPILRIWEVNQIDFQGEMQVELTEDPSRLLVHRRDQHLCLTPLSEEKFKMLTYFLAQENFASVCQKCHEEYPQLDIPQTFAECIQQGLLVGFNMV